MNTAEIGARVQSIGTAMLWEGPVLCRDRGRAGGRSEVRRDFRRGQSSESALVGTRIHITFVWVVIKADTRRQKVPR